MFNNNFIDSLKDAVGSRTSIDRDITSPRSHPRLCMHAQSAAPRRMLRGGFRLAASFWRQLLCDCADVVRLEAAAAANVTDSHVVGVTRVAMHVPARQYTGLER